MALLHIAKKQLSLDDETYRDILYVQAGVRSAKGLDFDGFERVMERLCELGFKSKKPRKRPADLDVELADAITEKQQGYIRYLFHEVGMTDTKRQAGFCRRQLGNRFWPQTRDEARIIIESLKKMTARGYRARSSSAEAAEEE